MNILFVEDEEIFYPLMDMLSKKFSFRLFIAGNLEMAKKTVEAEELHLVIIDYELPDGKGDELNIYIKENFPNIKTAISSGHGETLRHLVGYDYTVDKSDLINFIKEIVKINK
ncbi:response regulator [Calditerrivibrio nitroreducens]|uniref:Response regulatory domain-containing protein n=1 Tax=Calditerrivibrio nitroreducens (strain DSM 19672 / NBRC 101217 / Yu37-1) TaxID=768670 RepID=E4TEW1_CALNY|nr:response regulator [Calditerrivibrio nitroreducens]ADR18367.1 hypothetical protein Calni_0454 [Calditerrivibrio nitroreducens DSM 19672]